MFCKHKWKILSEKVSKSRAELGKELGLTVRNAGPSLMDRKLVQILTCDKCGKLEKLVEKL